MWDLYSRNFHLRGLCYFDVSSDLVKRYSQSESPEENPKPLTNRLLFKLCDNFLPLKHGNIFHGSSQSVLKNLKSDAASAYPLVNESIYYVLCEFLEHKLKHGKWDLVNPLSSN